MANQAPGTTEGQISTDGRHIWYNGVWLPMKESPIDFQEETVDTVTLANALLSAGGAASFVSATGSTVTKRLNGVDYVITFSDTQAVITQGSRTIFTKVFEVS